MMKFVRRIQDLLAYGWLSLVWLLSFLLGGVKWTPPPWLGAVFDFFGWAGRGAALWLRATRRSHPKALYGTVGGVVLVAAGAYGGWRYYESLPKPEKWDVVVQSLAATALSEGAVPQPLVMTFSGSTAPLAAIGKPVTAGIVLKPEEKGQWVWEADNSLVFTLEKGEDWRVGQEYEITLDPKMFPKHVLLEKYEVKTTLPEFWVTASNGEFYTDPKDPKIKRVLVTFKANYPLDTETFKDHVTMVKKVLKKGTLQLTKDKIPFTVTFDKFRGDAYVVSESIPVPLEEFMAVTTVDGVKSARGGDPIKNAYDSEVRVPGMYDYFRIGGVSATVVRNDKFEPEQVIVVETTAGALQQDILKNFTVYELPADKPATPTSEKQENYDWHDAGQIGPEILKSSKKVELTAIPTEKEYDTLHSFKFNGTIGRHLFFRIGKGIKSYGDYQLAKTHESTEKIPELPKEVSVMHQGSILSVSGDQKISVLARDLEALRFDVGRVLPSEINHLITQTYGTFQQPNFNSYSFKEENIAERFEEVRPLAPTGKGKAQYSYFDFSKYSQNAGERRGLFFLKAEGWDPTNKVSVGVQDKRFILITDLGMIVKTASDGTTDVFVASIRSGKPVAGVHVEVLGKNGLPVASLTTDDNGNVRFPTLRDFTQEKQPTVMLATKDKDMSFLPYERADRWLNFSRFDVGGEATAGAQGGLMSYLFSDRGIYRPGDTFHIGMIVKDSFWKKDLSGVSLEAVVTDPRGHTVAQERVQMNSDGFVETFYTTKDTSPTGEYQTSLYIVREGNKQKDWLGSTSVRVEEFLPDRMRISSRFSVLRNEGWVSPADLKGSVTLTNLFGTAATFRRIRGSIQLVPWSPNFRAYKDFAFFDPRYAKQSFSEALQDQKSDDKGEVTFDLDLKRFAEATYRLTFFSEGFEAEGGRSVNSQISILVSPNPYLIGHKPDGDLRYIKKEAKRLVDVIAVDPELKQTGVKGLKAHLVELRYVSVLTKQASGVYKYESVRKEVTVRTDQLDVGDLGTKLALLTTKAGAFALVIRDAEDKELSRIEYSVIGEANLTRNLERNAELQIKLSKADFSPGEFIEMEIVAPYAGAGLITIEKEKVYTYKWFNADNTASVQKIQVPEGLEGNGYINVSFVRDIASPEIFMSPLSFGVAPFSVSRERRINEVTLKVADLARPGEPFKIRYSTKKAGKIAVYAVDEGILQVARYQMPDPLASFFRKKALEVRTSQILDLILPEFEMVKALSAPGGDGYEAIAANLNPFKRKQQKPVAYWSGIIDAGPEEKELIYDVPDYFNGTLRVMAVAVAADSIGTKREQSTIRGPFVINPNAPTFVTPGDEFFVSVSVANNVEGSGPKAPVKVTVEPSAHLEVLDEKARTVEIAEGREATLIYKVKAAEILGSGSLKFTAELPGKKTKFSVDMSVRPPSPYFTKTQAGSFQDEKVDVPVTRTMYPEYRTLEASASVVPLSLAMGLVRYLEKFPYGCSEQIVSKVFPAVVLRNRPEFKFNPAAVAASVETTIGTLRARQNGEGAFGFWAANSYVSNFQAAYASHFLTEAKDKGFAVPPEMMRLALSYLSGTLKTLPTGIGEAREKAYALYVLTRNGVVTTNELDSLTAQLKEKFADDWQTDLIGIYVAATYKMLQKDNEAEKLIDKVEFGQAKNVDYRYFYDDLVRNSQLLYVLAKHFPKRMEKVDAKDVESVVKPIVLGLYNTTSSAFAILALDAYGTVAEKTGLKAMTIAEILGDDKKAEKALTLGPGLIKVAAFTDKAKAIRFNSEGGGTLYYQTTEAGFDKALPTQEIKEHLEVQREYHDEAGKVVNTTKLGDKLTVHLKIRAIQGERYDNVAIVDLLPAGFEVELTRSEEARESSNTVAPNLPQETVSQEGEEGEGEGGEQGGDDAEMGEPTAPEEGDSPPQYNAVSRPGPQSRIDAGGSSFSADYADLREDRVVLFGSTSNSATEFVYKIRSTNRGTFKVPPVFAESMYDRTVKALSLGSTITVLEQ